MIDLLTRTKMKHKNTEDNWQSTLYADMLVLVIVAVMAMMIMIVCRS